MKKSFIAALCALLITSAFSCSSRVQNILSRSAWTSQEYYYVTFEQDSLIVNEVDTCTLTSIDEERVNVSNCTTDTINEGDYIVVSEFPDRVELLPAPEIPEGENLSPKREPVVLFYKEDDEAALADTQSSDESAVSHIIGSWRFNDNTLIIIYDNTLTILHYDACRVGYTAHTIELSDCLYDILTDTVYTVTEKGDGSIQLTSDTSNGESPIILRRTSFIGDE